MRSSSSSRRPSSAPSSPTTWPTRRRSSAWAPPTRGSSPDIGGTSPARPMPACAPPGSAAPTSPTRSRCRRRTSSAPTCATWSARCSRVEQRPRRLRDLFLEPGREGRVAADRRVRGVDDRAGHAVDRPGVVAAGQAGDLLVDGGVEHRRVAVGVEQVAAAQREQQVRILRVAAGERDHRDRHRGARLRVPRGLQPDRVEALERSLPRGRDQPVAAPEAVVERADRRAALARDRRHADGAGPVAQRERADGVEDRVGVVLTRRGHDLVRSLYIERLPYIDEFAIRVEGPPARTWVALTRVLRGELKNARGLVRALGATPGERSGDWDGDLTGATLPGFAVAEARRPER